MEADVGILGAGPAGVLAATVLSAHGYRVILCGDAQEETPQAKHVHMIPKAAWERLLKLSGTHTLLPAQWPGRAAFDLSLREMASILPGVERRARYRSARFGGQGWQLELTDGPAQVDWLIDCSGSRRISAAALSLALGHPVSTNEAEHEVHYASWTLPRSLAATENRTIRFWCREKQAGLLIQHTPEAGTHITLQDHAASDRKSNLESVMELGREARLHDAGALCGISFEHASKPVCWPGQPATLLDIEEVAGAHIPWLAFGDALLTTPPYLGWGLSCLAEQLSLLKKALQQRSGPKGLPLSLYTLARSRFEQALVAAPLIRARQSLLLCH